MAGYALVHHGFDWNLDYRPHRSVLSAGIGASTVVWNTLTLSFLVLLVVGAETWFLPLLAAVMAVTFGVHDARTCGIRRLT